MPSRPWYKWYPGDWRADTAGLSLEEKGAYRELLDELWIHGSIPDQGKKRARILGIHGNNERRIWRGISEFFIVENGLITHPKITAQREKANRHKELAAKGGRKSGEVRARARSREKHEVRARASDPDKDKDLYPGFTEFDLPPARAREGSSLDREQAAALQRELEQRRAEAGVVSLPVRTAASVAESNSVTRKLGGDES